MLEAESLQSDVNHKITAILESLRSIVETQNRELQDLTARSLAHEVRIESLERKAIKQQP